KPVGKRDRRVRLGFGAQHNRLSHHSRATSRAFLSSRRATNFECRRWLPPVHSRNSNCPTRTGFNHTHSAIFAFVSPWPHRPLRASGRLANGHSWISSPLNFLNSCARVTGVKPLRVLAA